MTSPLKRSLGPASWVGLTRNALREIDPGLAKKLDQFKAIKDEQVDERAFYAADAADARDYWLEFRRKLPDDASLWQRYAEAVEMTNDTIFYNQAFAVASGAATAVLAVGGYRGASSPGADSLFWGAIELALAMGAGRTTLSVAEHLAQRSAQLFATPTPTEGE